MHDLARPQLELNDYSILGAAVLMFVLWLICNMYVMCNAIAPGWLVHDIAQSLQAIVILESAQNVLEICAEGNPDMGQPGSIIGCSVCNTLEKSRTSEMCDNNL